MNDANLRPWKPGESGNPNGRPPGHQTRHAFSEEILRTLRRVFVIEGETAMIRTAKENPSAFTAICAKLLPTEVTALIEQMQPRSLDAHDLAILRAIKEAIPDASNRSPDQILSFTLDAIRAHQAKLIES